MRRKFFGVLMSAAMAIAAFSGCGGAGGEKEAAAAGTDQGSGEAAADAGSTDAGQEAASGAKAGNVKVGFAIKTQNGPYFVKLVEAVKQISKEKGWDCTILTADEDTSKEAENMETFITQKMDVIFLDSIDPDSCIPSIDAAAEAKIPVINLDSGVNGGNYVTTVYSNNFENGRLSGIAYTDWMKKNGKEKEDIISILLSGAKGNVAGQERRTGLFAGIVQGRTGCDEATAKKASEEIEKQLMSGGKADYPEAKFKIVGQGWGAWTEEEGLTAAEDFITANPNVTTVLGENDQMLFGALTALDNAGLKNVAIVAAADGACAAYDLIKENDKAVNPYVVSGLNSPVLVAEKGIEIAEKIVVEKTPWEEFEKITLTEAAGVTKDLVDKYYDVGF